MAPKPGDKPGELTFALKPGELTSGLMILMRSNRVRWSRQGRGGGSTFSFLIRVTLLRGRAKCHLTPRVFLSFPPETGKSCPECAHRLSLIWLPDQSFQKARSKTTCVIKDKAAQTPRWSAWPKEGAAPPRSVPLELTSYYNPKVDEFSLSPGELTRGLTMLMRPNRVRQRWSTWTRQGRG